MYTTEDVVKTFPTKNITAFLDWFTYSDNSIDGQSRKKAYTFWESNMIAADEIGTVKALQKIHAYLFGGLYDFAGKIRTKTIWKDGTLFCRANLNALGTSLQIVFLRRGSVAGLSRVDRPLTEGWQVSIT